MKAADVSDYRQLAAFGDTVLAANYSEKNSFMFCTGKQNADGNLVFLGNYSPNYEYVKEVFAVRSGLVSKHRLFSENASANLYRCVDFVKANCEALTYEQERQLDKPQEKLTDGYPILEAEPPTFEQTAAPQQNKSGECWPAIPTITARLKLSASTVRRGIRDLSRASRNRAAVQKERW